MRATQGSIPCTRESYSVAKMNEKVSKEQTMEAWKRKKCIHTPLPTKSHKTSNSKGLLSELSFPAEEGISENECMTESENTSVSGLGRQGTETMPLTVFLTCNVER